MKYMSDKATDPICGVEIDKDKALRSRRGNEDYYFCSISCKAKFELSFSQEPEPKKEQRSCC